MADPDGNGLAARKRALRVENGTFSGKRPILTKTADPDENGLAARKRARGGRAEGNGRLRETGHSETRGAQLPYIAEQKEAVPPGISGGPF